MQAISDDAQRTVRARPRRSHADADRWKIVGETIIELYRRVRTARRLRRTAITSAAATAATTTQLVVRQTS